MKWRLVPALVLATACAFAQALAAAQEPAATPAPVALVPEGEPRTGGELRDRDFGVATRQFGLDRRVEMYQWRAGDEGYQRIWHASRIDSSGFDPGHENPPKLPIAGERWWSSDASLDGAPLDPSVLKALGQWRDFRPNFSRLPANLTATFQPEGDGLGSAENPLDPQIGDLRVGWRELLLPSLAGEVTLRNGAWHLRSGQVQRAQVPAAAPVVAKTASQPARALWPWLLVALVPVLLVVAGRRRRKVHR